MGKRRKSGFRKAISMGYRILSKLNTAAVISTGDPVRISRHLTRKKTTALGSKIIPGVKK